MRSGTYLRTAGARTATYAGLLFLAAGSSVSACALVLGDFDKGGGTGGATTSGSTGGHATSSSTSSGISSCKVDKDCNEGNPCTTDSCDTQHSMCLHPAIPDGPPPGYTDTTKDCKTLKCVAGMVQTVAADTDAPSSGSVCLTNTCAMQMVVHNFTAAGQSCGTNQTCDGMGSCVGCNANGDCADPGACRAVVCTSHKCVISDDAAGKSCSVGGKVCDGMGGCVGCVTAADCTSGNCAAGNTCGLALDGHACSADADCNAGHCAGGVCCDHTCDGTCEACTAALTGQADGVCAPVTAGQAAPAGQCVAATCGNTGNCAAGGACEQVVDGKSCGAPAGCAGDVFHNEETCSGGTCGPAVAKPCSPYVCAGAVCGTTCAEPTECATGYTCTAASTCLLAAGQPCTLDADCASGMCTAAMVCQ